MDHNDFAERIERIVGNVELAVSGKRDSVFLAVVAMLAGGHVLIEDVPGVARRYWPSRSPVRSGPSFAGYSSPLTSCRPT